VSATVGYNATTRVATLDPSADLAANTQYTATLTGGAAAIRDTAGNPLTTGTWTFTTAAAADKTAPTVTTRAPSSNASNVSRTGNITVTFSEAVSGVSGTTVTVKNTLTGTPIAAVASYSASTRIVTLNPNSTLAANTKFTVTLTGGTNAIKDAAGNPLTTTSWTFTTGR
jgi:hypothetical protein